ncbi:MAG: T9SS type A sorting domain-containing protein [Bacteriovoracaceae bacterium]|nr:T9SS type A sorting domain-containing protein [Bacteriovoracaceae bacterium]
MKKTILSLLLFGTSALLHSQSINWGKTYGGSQNESHAFIQPTSDGGYIMSSDSNSNDGDVSGHHGNGDFWIIKIDAQGNLQWQKSYGGSQIESARSIQPTTDGGYIVVGLTLSNDGDVSNNHGDEDGWIIKIDAQGNLQWQKTYGGSLADRFHTIQATAGGYIVAGYSSSNDGDVVSLNHGNGDLWVVKIDLQGSIIWEKNYGGTGDEWAKSIQPTTSGYVIGGYTNSNDGDVTGHHGNGDFWVMHIDSQGNLQWQKTYGGSLDELFSTIQKTTDGGYVMTGYTTSNDGDITNHQGLRDFWVVKVDNQGNLQWQKTYGGNKDDWPYSVQQTTDGGYIVAGLSNSNQGDVTDNLGGYDFWLIKIDVQGNLQWQKTYGGSNQEGAEAIQETPDGGYIVIGSTLSSDGDVTNNYGGSDLWVLKLDSAVNNEELPSIKSLISPNPNNGFFFIQLPQPPMGPVTFFIYDLTGKIMTQIESASGQNKILVDVKLPSGIYFVEDSQKQWKSNIIIH